MATKSKSDRKVIDAIGDEALLAERIPPHCVKQWKYRGIPWSARAKVARIAAGKRIKLPPNFVEQRPA